MLASEESNVSLLIAISDNFRNIEKNVYGIALSLLRRLMA